MSKYDQYPGLPGPETPGDYVQEELVAGLKSGGRKFARGMSQVSLSSFGKGMLYTAAAIVIGLTIGMGFGAVMGEITTAGGALATFGEGLSLGLGKAFHLLTTLKFAGPVLAVGGAIGIAAGLGKRSDELDYSQAKQKNVVLQKARQAPELQLQQARAAEASSQQRFDPLERDPNSPRSFLETEIARRQHELGRVTTR